MKKYIIIVSFLLAGLMVHAQEIEYSYDDAGNRIQRKVLVQRSNAESSENEVASQMEDKKGAYSFVLAPNPTTGEFTVTADPTFMLLEGKKLWIHAMNGQLLKELDFSETTRKIDLSGLASGSYLVRLTASGGYRNEWRVIKE